MTTYVNIPDTDVDAESPVTVALMTALRDNPTATIEDFIGCMFFHGATTPPAMTLECNGAAISRTTFADLFAVIGTVWGAGDGSTTFNVPDMRGEFPRGWDNGRGVDSGRAFASFQSSANLAHTHGAGSYFGDLGDTAGNAHFFGASNENQGDRVIEGTSGSTGGSESRPRNQAGMYVIVYKGKPV